MALAPSSPRLPSPPPPAEIQLGPKSPSGVPALSPQATQIEQTLVDANSKRRVHPGTKAVDMAPGPPLVPLDKVRPCYCWHAQCSPDRDTLLTELHLQLDSPFQLQEHLAALHNEATSSGTRALTRGTAQSLADVPDGIDRTLWLYELCRFLISQCNTLIVGFLFDTPPCSAITCPEMRASEWQFLCAVHETPKSCCAIDYCCHTLDWAANIVTDQKIFPSRFMVQNDSQNKNMGLRNLVNVFRRLHRIFAHAWFQHRSVFWAVEGQSGLYILFKTVCDTYDLLPAENYKLPPEAEGLEAPSTETEAEKPTPTILKNDSQSQQASSQGGLQRNPFNFEDANIPPPSRTNTRRHIRASPSTGSAVTTVMETEEEEGNNIAKKMKELQVSAPETVEEEPDSADVPVIVEQSAMAEAPTPTAETSLLSDDDDQASEADQTVVEFGDEPEEQDNAEPSGETPHSVESAETELEQEQEHPAAPQDASLVKDDDTVTAPPSGHDDKVVDDDGKPEDVETPNEDKDTVT